METNTKTCPYCGEAIDKSALKCPCCGEFLTDSARKLAVEQEEKKKQEEFETSKENRRKKNEEESKVGLSLLLFFLAYAVISLGIFFGVIGTVLHYTIPSKTRMEKAIIEDVYESVKDNSSSIANLFGEEVGALTSLFFDLGVSSDEITEQFYNNNVIEIDENWFWSVGYIYNKNYVEEGALACFGILGMVFPLVEWDDFILIDNDSSSSESPSDSYSNNSYIADDSEDERLEDVTINDNANEDLTFSDLGTFHLKGKVKQLTEYSKSDVDETDTELSGFTYIFNEYGHLISFNGTSIYSEDPKLEVGRDEQGRITNISDGFYEESFAYDANGFCCVYKFQYVHGGLERTITKVNQDYLPIVAKYSSMEGLAGYYCETKGTEYYEYQNFDNFSNWTVKIIKGDANEKGTTTDEESGEEIEFEKSIELNETIIRKIIYY